MPRGEWTDASQRASALRNNPRRRKGVKHIHRAASSGDLERDTRQRQPSRVAVGCNVETQ